MVTQDDSDVVISVDESDEGGSPADWGGDVEKGENGNLEHDEPEENHIYELYHFEFLFNILFMLSGLFKIKSLLELSI